MTDVEKLVEIINDFFGCDAAYFDVNPFDLATHLVTNGVKIDNQSMVYNIKTDNIVIEDIVKEVSELTSNRIR